VAGRERSAGQCDQHSACYDDRTHCVNVLLRTEHTQMDVAVTDPQLCLLFHQLNNQLGIVLAHAELLEAKALDVKYRARAEQVVKSVLDAMGTAKEIRRRSEPQPAA
jgi:DNA-binding MltR family transcriptional regulator